MESLYFDFEKRYDPGSTYDFMVDLNYTLPFISVAAYVLFCYYGQKMMKDRPAYDLRLTLASWNLFLSLFSSYGAVRTVPHLFHRLTTVSFEETVCESPQVAFGCGAAGLASQLFILSKLPELLDTVFIVLRKKPLIFLHWYHHVTVLLYCWQSYVSQSSAGLYFIAMNYSVHAIMYFYYFLQATKSIPTWFPSWIITLAQISQMFMGCFIVTMSFYYHLFGGVQYAPGTCNNSLTTLAAGLTMYSSYLYLFVDFAVKRFIWKSHNSIIQCNNAKKQQKNTLTEQQQIMQERIKAD